MKKLLFMVAVASSLCVAQDYVLFPRPGSSAGILSIKTGTVAQSPTTCRTGDVYIANDAPSGTQWRSCNASGTGFDAPQATIAGGSDGQVPIWNAAQSKYIAGDPIVSGPDAPGTAPTRNPVQMGVFDGTNVQRASGDTSGRLNVNINGTVSSSSNITQFGGTNLSTGTGTGGAGIPRVTVSNDSTVGLVAGSAKIGQVAIDQTTPGTTNLVQVGGSLPPGTAVIGHVITDTNSTMAVTQATGTNLHAVIDSGTVTANAGTGTMSTNTAQVNGNNVNALPGTGTQFVAVTGIGGAGLPNSGVVTVQGIANMVPMAVKQSLSPTQPWIEQQGAPNSTANAWPTKLTDGSNVATVKAASTAAASADTAIVVAQSPNTSLPAGTNAIGTVTIQPQSPLMSGMIPVMVVMGPPPLSPQQANNPLVYKSQMLTYCTQNLSGCGPGLGR